jgi:hypothetical protein
MSLRISLNYCGKSRPYRDSIPRLFSQLRVTIPTELFRPPFVVNKDVFLNVMPRTCSHTDDQITCYLSSLTHYIAVVSKGYPLLSSLQNDDFVGSTFIPSATVIISVMDRKHPVVNAQCLCLHLCANNYQVIWLLHYQSQTNLLPRASEFPDDCNNFIQKLAPICHTTWHYVPKIVLFIVSTEKTWNLTITCELVRWQQPKNQSLDLISIQIKYLQNAL